MVTKQEDDMQETIDQDKLAEEAAFNAAMAGEDDAYAPGNDQNAEENAESHDHTKNLDQSQTESNTNSERAEVFPGFTKEELTEALALIPQLRKSIDTQSGTFGRKFQEQERTIQSLQEQLQQRATTTQQQIAATTITADSFKKLREDGFEVLAESLAHDLGGLLPGGNAGIDVDSIKKEILQQIDGRFNEITQRQFDESLTLLNNQHPDWQDVASFSTTDSGLVRWKNPEFGNWVVQQPEELQVEILESSDPRKIAGWIGEYKNSLAGDQSNDTKPSNSRRNVLQKAVTPRGVTASKQMSDKQIEDEAMRRAMAGED